MKKFCIAGPIDTARHYFIPKRLDFNEIATLIDDRQYFVLHAPRQSGKTTAIQEIIRLLNEKDTYSAVYINIENAQAARENIEKALITIIETLRYAIAEQIQDEEKTVAYFDDIVAQRVPVTLNALQLALAFWAKNSAKRIVLFIDEIDSLIGDSLLSLLRQIRSGYIERPQGFPQSICFIGLRDVRDYRVWSKEAGVQVSAASPFNIKAKSLVLPNFSLEDVANLYDQYTKESRQVFEKEAIEYAYCLTQGQPWLVNALGHEAAFVNVKDYSQPITKIDIERAKDSLIKRRDTHLDSLIDKLREERVFPIIDAIINGQCDIMNFTTDSVQYVRDLGLIKQNRMEIANPIYTQTISRVGFFARQSPRG